MSMNLKMIRDNRKQVKGQVEEAIVRALEICAGKAETYAKTNLTRQKAVDTGALRNSVNHKVDKAKLVAYVGTNIEYAPYIEFGTGIYYVGGRRTSWTYKDSDGQWHMTNGMRARPFLKPAVADHQEEYKNIIQSELSKL